MPDTDGELTAALTDLEELLLQLVDPADEDDVPPPHSPLATHVTPWDGSPPGSLNGNAIAAMRPTRSATTRMRSRQYSPTHPTAGFELVPLGIIAVNRQDLQRIWAAVSELTRSDRLPYTVSELP